MPAGRWLSGWFALLALCLAAGCGLPFEPGVWSIEGSDPVHGPYRGSLELRSGAGGGLDVIRVVRFAAAETGDGRRISTVWTGRCETRHEHAAIIEFSLDRGRFLSSARGQLREGAARTPLEIRARIAETGSRNIFVEYGSVDDPSFSMGETGRWAKPAGPDPIWISRRSLRTAFDAGVRFRVLKPLLFEFFEGYHSLPAVRRFTREAAFREAKHYTVIDRTNFEFYRVHPDRIRAVNTVVDPISLAEEEIRAEAFRASCAEKAAYYQTIMDSGLVGPHGLVVNRLSPGGPERPDADGALWTGIYAYTQALRYRLTGEAGALRNLRDSLRGLFTLMDITGDPRTFARTVRLAGPPLGGGWVRGKGEHAHLDWLAGGNNDMSKGLLLGFVAGWEGLPGADPLRGAIPRRAVELLELCQFLEDPAAACGPSAVGRHLPSGNPGIGKLLAGITNQRSQWIEEGHRWLRHPIFVVYAGRGGGPVYLWGFSDWSGNHLTLVKTLVLQRLLQSSGDRRLDALWRRASARAWRILRPVEPPLHAALAVASGALTEPVERAEARDQAVWGLRSFPVPKHPYPVDHRVRDDFIMSPFPSLPWKLDWEANSLRHQSTVARGVLEGPMASYLWIGNPFNFASEATGDDLLPGVDYLFLYWIARHGGLITESD